MQLSALFSSRRAPTHGIRAAALGVLLLLAVPGLASRGDRLPEFRDCVADCTAAHCTGTPAPLPLHLRLLQWDCASECDYACQRTVTAARVAAGQPVEQFHGKWPFRRLLGVQEPFSVLFSLLNGYAHVAGLRILARGLPRGYPLAPYYRGFAYAGLACWFWSAVFHTRDTRVTERMDYFGAGANVLYGLYYTPVRLARLYRPSRARVRRLWGLACVAAYAAHVGFLTLVRWDYSYNMAANVAVGGLTNVMWAWYSVAYYVRLKRFWAAWPGLIVTLLVMAMSLELLDFPPIADAIDAHSLWHAATVLPALWWYRFLVEDARQDKAEGEFAVRLKA